MPVTANEFASTIRKFIVQQTSANQRILDEIKKVNDRLVSVDAAANNLQEYRKAQQDRYNHIGERFARLDESIDQIERQQRETATLLNSWCNRAKLYWLIAIGLSSLIAIGLSSLMAIAVGAKILLGT